mmetsp:Transcript_24190/g.55015  ORF Transcript_24190/g.55015 Transcript_24190/m.55015 type:complete len:107 (-) Transcript_24190:1503-1823(-)
MLSNAGPGGTIYPDFVSFTVAELMKHIGVYILNRVIPPPRVEYKMSSQEKDPINGNDMVFNSLGLLFEDLELANLHIISVHSLIPIVFMHFYFYLFSSFNGSFPFI